ncbi:MAG: hypothetical protein GY851_25155, partial [bacterium]|nr:hypothetical protein [bacterium]
MVCALCLVATMGFAAAQEGAPTEEGAVFDFGTGRLAIDGKGYATLEVGAGHAPWPVGGAPWPGCTEPIVRLATDDETLLPEAVTVTGDVLTATFANGAACELAIRPGAGFLVFEVTRLDAPDDTERLRLLSLPVPEEAEVMGTLNAARTDTHVVALSAAEPNVHAFPQSPTRHDGDRE